MIVMWEKWGFSFVDGWSSSGLLVQLMLIADTPEPVPAYFSGVTLGRVIVKNRECSASIFNDLLINDIDRG